MDLSTFRDLFAYGDWANARLLEAAAPLGDDALDRAMEIGPGTLRRVLLHLHNGESVWTKRWIAGRGGEPAQIPWPSEAENATPAEIASRLEAVRAERDAFLAGLTPADLSRPQVYRDSKGSLFRATLGEMIAQSIVHSIHHRAQAVNMLRRLGAGLVELDYMMSRRAPV